MLNIDLPVLSGIGGWQRFSDAIVQSLSVRASGFGVISITSLAPSVLYVFALEFCSADAKVPLHRELIGSK